MKKRTKWELVFFPPPVGATGTAVTIHDNPGYIYPGPYTARIKSQLNKQEKHTAFYNFAVLISFAEHWKFVAESSEFQLTLSRAHRAHFFKLEIRKKMRDILSEKRERGWR